MRRIPPKPQRQLPQNGRIPSFWRGSPVDPQRIPFGSQADPLEFPIENSENSEHSENTENSENSENTENTENSEAPTVQWHKLKAKLVAEGDFYKLTSFCQNVRPN